jgi:hypothetical protein
MGALQKRGLSYDQERDRPAMEAAKQRAEIGRDPEQILTPSAPTPEVERTFADTMTDIGRTAGQYLLDQANPIKQIERDFRTLQHLGQLAADGYRTAKDLLPKPDGVERLQQAMGLEPSGKDATERLQQASGLEPSRDSRDTLERLNTAAGVERPDPSTTPDLTSARTPGAASTLEPAIEREAEEQIIEYGLELLL